ncbi:uncharacterized protein LOC129595206 [Paramacrobiotus metropolitanus]|uniref:uncharacterized protein LOC129595206 n=1 Tax=Paramacrobiotus metropolitanus TaxID=2943436 RepID=UPI00244608F0|nr:uncharacterized protein LOC129595206 [Paramacrobiotus metropolitanus]
MDARWWVLCCCGIMSYVNDFYGDEPSVLVQRLTGTAEACDDGSDTCVNLDVQQFNMLFSASSWASAGASVVVGIVVDKYGCKEALWVTGGCLVLGSLFFVCSTYLTSTYYTYVLAILGRILYGLGNGATDVITHRIKSSWFLYKELALAFAIHIMCGRFGDATVFFVIGTLVDIIGMQACLWLGFGLTVVCAGAAVVLSFWNEQSAAMPVPVNVDLDAEIRHVTVQFVGSLDGVFLCLVFIVFLYYGTISAFIGNGPNFISDTCGYSEALSSYVIGLIYLISPLQLLFGTLTDRYGHRGYWLLTSASCLVLFFSLQLAVSHLPPWLLTVGIGVGFNIFSPTFWSSVPLIVQPAFLGTAIGCLKFFHFAGTGTMTAVAGVILNTGDADVVPWWRLFELLITTSSVCLLSTVALAVMNARTGHRLTPSQRERDAGLQRGGVCELMASSHTRWWVLACCCITDFLADLYVDAPSVLVQRLTGTSASCSSNGTDQHCVQLDVKQFNLLFSIGAWASSVTSVAVGFGIDRYGCRVAVWICVGCMVTGALLFPLATYCTTTRATFALMVTSQLIYGLGDGALDVILSTIIASWFLYKELGLAYSFYTLSGRLGSAVVFYLVGALVVAAGLRACQWFLFGVIALAGLSAVVLSILHGRHEEKVTVGVPRAEPRWTRWWTPTGLRELFRGLDGIFWCFVLMTFLYYGSISTFTANGPNFISQAYGYSESQSSYIVGIIYDISILCLLVGWLTDRFGYRDLWLLSSTTLLFLAFFLETLIHTFPAWLLTTLIGLAYTIFGPTLWACVPLIVPSDTVGSALGILKFFHYTGIGALTAIASSLLNTDNPRHVPWEMLFIMLTVTSAVCVVLNVAVCGLNIRTGKRLTPSQRERAVGVSEEVVPLCSDQELVYGSQKDGEKVGHVNVNDW